MPGVAGSACCSSFWPAACSSGGLRSFAVIRKARSISLTGRSDMALFYDTHAHLDFPDFAEDLDQVLTRASAAGIARIICVGTDLESSRRAIRIAEGRDEVFAVVGWHPGEAEKAPEDVRPQLLVLAAHPKVVALGETGLDYYRLPSSQDGSPVDDAPVKAKQVALFKQHLEVAMATGLNCVIHQRKALGETLDVFKRYADLVRGQFHCFSDDANAMKRILDLGSIVSFTGILTFKNAREVREVLAETPNGDFMLETDCPYLAPVPYRGKRCEPAYVSEIAVVAAEVRGQSMEALSRVTRDTAHEFFPKLGA